MLERLQYLKISPRRILDAGSGPARDARALMAAFGKVEFIALDHSLAMLRAGRARFFEKKKFVCGELARLPLAAQSIDFVWSNMALHWAEPLATLREFQRVLAPEGLLMFSTLGPDSLRELRVAAGPERVHEFLDMHDIGDMLVHAGFADPVMDMEYVTLTYDAPRALLAELKAIGATNRTRGRPHGLMGRNRFARVLARLERARKDGRIPATFEVVYGHAWKGEPRTTAEGHPIVRLQRPGRPR